MLSLHCQLVKLLLKCWSTGHKNIQRLHTLSIIFYLRELKAYNCTGFDDASLKLLQLNFELRPQSWGSRRTYLTILKRAWSANFKMVWPILLRPLRPELDGRSSFSWSNLRKHHQNQHNCRPLSSAAIHLAFLKFFIGPQPNNFMVHPIYQYITFMAHFRLF
jgi:hypothetical protein